MTSLALTIGLLLGAAIVIYFACEYFVNGVEWVGRKLAVSQQATGSILAAFGTVAAFAAAPTPDEVVAVVNGKEIKRSDIVEFQQSTPQLRQVPLEMVADQIIEHLVNGQLVIQQAYKDKLQDDPKVKQRLQQVQDQVLQQAYLQKKVEGQLTDEVLRKKYDEVVKNAPPKEEVHARHILLPNEDDADWVTLLRAP